MVNKRNLWFVTLCSLIIVLSIYYVTLSDSSLSKIIEQAQERATPVSVNVEESSMLVSLRIQEDEEVLKETENYQAILLDAKKTLQEKNNAYNSLMALRDKKAEEEKIEKKIKEEFSLDSFVKVKEDHIHIVLSSSEHDAARANNIIRSIQSLYQDKKYITVKFQTS
ncbi:MAG: SpoIIIAH-like family protein [Bacilli bacterium]|nr:SpoIIIAH-like family protein [Bacilli bacterium]